jgi:hypothetical protein
LKDRYPGIAKEADKLRDVPARLGGMDVLKNDVREHEIERPSLECPEIVPRIHDKAEVWFISIQVRCLPDHFVGDIDAQN